VNAREAAVSYLARFTRTEFQVRTYLKKKKFAAGDIDEAIAFLLRNKLLSDQYFAESYLLTRIARLDGPRKIKALMRKKGLSDEIIDNLLNQHYPSELQIVNAIKLIRKRSSRSSQSVKRFIASRGFSGYVIIQAFKQAK